MTRWKLLAAGLIFAAPLLGAVPARAAENDAQAAFEDANRAYEKGDFDDALQKYSALAARGFGGVAMDFNLGNVHFKHGERGQAVLWYERALRLAPRDSDIRFNLSLARAHIKSEGDNVLKRALTYFTAGELAAATSVFSGLFFIAVGLVALGRLRGDVLPAMSLTVSAGLLLLSGAWTGAAIYMDREPVAIVVSPPGEVRNGPGTDYAVGFTIPDGSEVLVLNRRPEWSQVGVPEQGLKGWMPTSEIELIAPHSAF